MDSQSRPVVAAFDVDRTLTTRDCVTPFLYRTVRYQALRTLLRHPGHVVESIVRRDRDTLKELVCMAFAGMDARAVDAAGEAFAGEIARRWLRPDTLARLRWHGKLDHLVLLVSASLEPYLVPLGRNLGASGVVCTRLESDERGFLTGRLAGPNCRGPEKVRRLDDWLAANGVADAVVWAYGDSAGDDALLHRADHPIRVGRKTVSPEPL